MNGTFHAPAVEPARHTNEKSRRRPRGRCGFPAQTRANLLFALLFLAAFALRLETLFATLRAIGGALHQLGTDQFEHRLLGAVALAGPQASDAGVAAVALAESRAQRVEQLLHRLWSPQHHACLTPGV